MDVQIYKAGSKDINKIMQWRMEVLHDVFSEVEDKTDWDALYQANEDHYLHALDIESHIACFADVDEETVGCGGICLQKELPSPDNPSGRCAYLMNIYTRPAHRGKGIASAVVKWLVNEAKARGADKIYLEASEAGRGAYKKAGFTDMHGFMHLTQ